MIVGVLSTAVLVAILLAQTATAAEVLPIAVSQPQVGQLFQRQDASGIAFTVQGVPSGATFVSVAVSATSAVQADGVTLVDDSEDYFGMSEVAGSPGTYTGVSNAAPTWWTDRPGTYYWQVVTSWLDTSTFTFRSAASPAVEITVVPRATDAVRRYYAGIAIRRPAIAWTQLTTAARAALGPYTRFVRGFRTTRNVRVISVRSAGQVSGHPVTTKASVRFATTDRDLCGRVIQRTFGGNWTAILDAGQWQLQAPQIRQLAGPRLVTRQSLCPRVQQPTRASVVGGGPPGGGSGGTGGGSGCNPNYAGACIPNSPVDLDCGDVSATDFRVVGTDVYRFDGDHDGIACES